MELPPDGERFVDVAEKPIPPANTWDMLSMNQLIDVKTQLEEKAWVFRNNPQIAAVLRRSIANITQQITSRSSM